MGVDSIWFSPSKNDIQRSGKQPSVNSSLILLSVAAIGTITFILVASSFPVKQEEQQALYPKEKSFAASQVLFIDSSGNPIAQTSGITVLVQLSAPWEPASQGTQNVVPQTKSVALSEDGVTYDTPSTYTEHPLIVEYVFKNTTPCPLGTQCKTLYAKFIATTGIEQVFTAHIELQKVTPSGNVQNPR